MKYGHTFSHRHTQSLGLDVAESFQFLLKLKPNYIRLCSYWDELEPEPGSYDFSQLDQLIKRCIDTETQIVLTLGCKAPRYPEFFFPEWIKRKNTDDHTTQQALFHFLEAAVKHFQDYTPITHWQIENEPLDEVWPDKTHLSVALLEQEITRIRRLDSRPILTTVWGNQTKRRNHLPQLQPISDILGIDVYFKQYVMPHVYRGPEDTLKSLTKQINRLSKPVWITELQAEPWEKNQANYLRGDNPSFTPRLLKDSFRKAHQLPVEAVFFWGYEYWYWRYRNGDSRYIDTYRELFKA